MKKLIIILVAKGMLPVHFIPNFHSTYLLGKEKVMKRKIQMIKCAGNLDTENGNIHL